ncbi:MAG: O-methyltransferase [Vibrio sp.]
MNETMKLLNYLSAKGIENDTIAKDKKMKYLNITHDTGEFLSLMVRAVSAENILELGTSNGYSTIWLAQALNETGKIITIENDSIKANEARENFKAAKLNNCIQLIEGNIERIIPNIKDQYDLVFLDADRRMYMDILQDIIRLTKVGGVIICDNASSHYDELKDLIDFFNKKQGYTTCHIPIGKGEFVIHKEQ